MQKLNILIVDDEKSVRTGLEYLINGEADMKVSDTAANGRTAIEKIKNDRPDVVLLDIQMPVMNGIDCITHIRQFDLELPILILTTFNETKYIIHGLAQGANGYLIKGLDFAKLTQCIRDIYYKQFVLPSEVAVKLSQHLLQQKELIAANDLNQFRFPPGTFNKKEQQMIFLLQKRLPLKDIAENMALSEGTLRNYLSKLYDKLNVSNRNEAIQAIQRFIIP